MDGKTNSRQKQLAGTRTRDIHTQLESQKTSHELGSIESQQKCHNAKPSDKAEIRLCEDEKSALRISQKRVRSITDSSQES